MIPEENIIPPLPFWIRRQLHRPCWDFGFLVNAFFCSKNNKQKLEKELRRRMQSNVLLLDSGSSALEQALSQSKSINKFMVMFGKELRNEVILPSYCCKTVADCIINCGLTPHFVDVERNYVVSERTIRPAINKKTLAIIVPHMFNTRADVSAIKKAWPKITIIEDKAMRLQGELIGDYGILSFNIGKQIQSMGGGALLIKQ